MSWNIVKGLKERRAQAFNAASELRTAAAKDTRDLTSDEKQKHDAILADVANLGEQIEREERAMELGSKIGVVTSDVNVEKRGNSFGMAERDFNKYSLIRAISRRVDNQPLDGIEKEVSDEIALRTGKSATGFYFPTEHAFSSRALDTTAGVGALQSAVAPSFIELLRNAAIVSQLGATMLPNMVGAFAIPRQSGAGSAYWLAEGGAPTTSAQTLDQVAFAQRTVGAYTDVTRKFVKQTSIDAEAFIRNDLATVLALAIDAAAFSGTGSSNQPLGILNNSNVPTVAGGTNGLAMSWANAVALETTVGANNGLLGKLAYVSNSKVKGAGKTTERATNTGKYLIADDGTLNGYPLVVSNHIPATLTKGSGSNLSAAIFGNFADLVVAMWGGLDILVDPYTGSSTGTIRVAAMQDLDIQLRNPKSFAKIVDIIA